MKYKLTTNTKQYQDVTLYQIEALQDILKYNVNAGALGGWIQSEANLSQNNNAWVSGDAKVFGDAWVSDNAEVFGNAKVFGDAWVSDNAEVSGDAK